MYVCMCVLSILLTIHCNSNTTLITGSFVY